MEEEGRGRRRVEGVPLKGGRACKCSLRRLFFIRVVAEVGEGLRMEGIGGKRGGWKNVDGAGGGTMREKVGGTWGRVGVQQLQVEGERRMEDGGWRMEDGGWRMEG